MIYIDLYLEKLGTNDLPKQYTLDQILEQTQVNVIVILGAPGSGKSAILKKYEVENPEKTDLLTIKSFIKLDNNIKKNILLLDGLDEFRSTASDKAFTIVELGSKISKIINTKVVITCREMDWYGDDDKNALKDEIKTDIEIYRILPLNNDLEIELAKLEGITKAEKFVNDFSDTGLINSPLMLSMMAKLYIPDSLEIIDSKSTLYSNFVKFAREKNPNYAKNNVNYLSEEEIFQFGGYLACFYIFSNIDSFDEAFIDKVSDLEFSINKLKIVLKSQLFNDKRFRHRTIAEFLAGRYLAKNLLNTSTGMDVKRVKSLFTDSDKIPTELRGTYAWLCSISKNHELIAVDPYYQAIHGDNALFDIEQKKEIVLDIQEYAQTSPYFHRFNHHIDLQGFYDARLEKFFIQELNEAVRLKNHYLYFICSVLEGATELGRDICEVIKANILDNAIPNHYRDNLIQILNHEDDFLVTVLNKIKNKELHDEKDYLKETILKKLYPTVIGSEEVGQYLQFYQGDTIGHCFFLDRTPYAEQRKLVDEIHRFSLIYQNGGNHLIFNDSIKHFVNKYFLDTVLRFENDLDAEDIYEILKYFKSAYYREYESIDFDSFSWRLKEGHYDEKIQKLANELYRLYVQDELKSQKERYDFFGFNYFFSLKHANNCYATLLSCMNNKLDHKVNEELFVCAIAYATRDEEKKIIPISELRKIANEFDLNDIIEARLNPQKLEWEIKAEKQKEQQRKKDQEQLESNEDHFTKKSDEEIQKSFNDLYWFSKFVYFEKEKKELRFITQNTFDRLKEILRRAIYSDLIEPELLTIQQLAELKGNHRNIDNMYYAALALNNDSDITKKLRDEVFLKYLYINSLLSSNTGNIKKADFHEKVDYDFALNTQKEYIDYLVSIHTPELKNTVTKYIKNETDVKLVEILAMTYGYNNRSFQDTFIDNFLGAFNFDISKEDLKLLKPYIDEANKITIKALECFTGEACKEFSMAMAIAMYEIFSYHNFRIFNLYPNPKRASVVSKMMSAFDTEESITRVNGIQSQKNICADFLTNQVLQVLKLEECEELLKDHENDIWTNQIKHAIDEKKQAKMDSQGYGHYPIEYIKDFFLKQTVVSAQDFFVDVCSRIKKLSIKIESNRGNEKKRFYNATVAKDENECRDIIRIDLEHLYQAEWSLIKEQHEADNRVDLNIKYKNNDHYEVQIECKKDKNQKLFSGIQEQLINQYFSSEVQYGIYLVFYFGEIQKSPEELLIALKSKVPANYKNKIEIIIIDLRK